MLTCSNTCGVGMKGINQRKNQLIYKNDSACEAVAVTVFTKLKLNFKLNEEK